ncbi:histidinol phosphatase [Thermoanaerobacterium thermosaccharolyticum]|uniref:Histidinol phosphatase n=1 Tax=Thermoanaerobacterium thermosaccharolyticum TaxID=1517 RepID=A0A223I0V8_THETR|nr:PHP domain-containing protein [Thermoanaerobacterium thermosaccharolyticum]AST58329.1 histidinol phosphatase [Thermoanaerobacterium thermosaccharolyticum]
MKLFADYHTHTVFSHGKGTIEDNVKAAIKMGLREIAITDHGPGHIFFGLRKRDYKKIRDEIDRLNDKYPNIRVLMGVEANLISLNGDIDVDDELMKYLDILLMGYHTGVVPKDLYNCLHMFGKNAVSKYFGSMKSIVRDQNTDAIIKAINKYKINIITHPGAKVDLDTKRLALAAKSRGTALEINSSHGYMTVEYVRIAKSVGAKFVIDSDAHTSSRVGDFSRGIEIAREAALTAKDIINAEE